MWGYQPHFRIRIKILINNVMKELGIPEPGVECLLVGAKIPGRQNRNDVCVEPEDGKWPIKLFSELLNVIEAEIAEHPDKNILYSDEASMLKKPENIRRDSTRSAVQKILHAYDEVHFVHSFAGRPAPVDDYYVVPVLQLPIEILDRFHKLRKPISVGRLSWYPSLIHAAIHGVLTEAYDELLRPDPGFESIGQLRSPKEIIRRSATSFMSTLGIAIDDKNFSASDLFDRLNMISSLMYEKTGGTGRLLLAKQDNNSVNMLLKFTQPVPLRESRWSRKALQMASAETVLIADCEKIYGLGKFAADSDAWKSQDVFEIKFLDHYHWSLTCGNKVLLVSKYGTPSLPQDEIPKARLLDTYQRLFPEAGDDNFGDFFALFKTAVMQSHGSMLIVAKDAKLEADRLQDQGTRIEPTKLTSDLFRQVSDIDGAIIIDSFCVCHAIGVILDGPAREECTPARGSRYNSGIRYVCATDSPRLAVVVSDDRTVDVIPVLHLQIKRSDIDEAISQLEASTSEDYHSSINWLDHHRFYLSQENCNRVNASLKRIKKEPMEVGEIRMNWKKFSPNPSMNDSYFVESKNT